MKFTITVSDCTAEEAKTVMAALTGGKATTVTSEAPKTGKGKGKTKPAPVEDETEEEVEEEEETAVDEDEPDFDAEPEEEEFTEEDETEEEEAPAKTKGKAKTPAVTIESVIAAFQATKKVLIKKLKSEEKANAKLNALLKKHGSKSIKGLKPALLATVLKEVKALAA